MDEAHSLNALKNAIQKSRANAVRLVTAGRSWHWNQQSATPAQKEMLVETALEASLVPMIEMHDGTCVKVCDLPPIDENGEQRGEMGLKQIVDEWLEPANRRMLQEHEDVLLLNIANEWGDNNEAYLSCYKDAITRLREADINNVLVIDAGGNCGQNPNSLLKYGDELFAHDPLNKLVLSIHLYGFWRTDDKSFSDWTPPFSVEEVFPQLADLDAPVIIGEYGWYRNDSERSFNPRKLMEVSKAHGIGWYFWAWADGSEDLHSIVSSDDYSYDGPDDLSEAGATILLDPEVGFEALAEPPTGF